MFTRKLIVRTLCLMKTLQNIARLQEADKRNYSKYKNTKTCKNELFNVKTYRRLHFLLRNPRDFFLSTVY